MPKKSTKKPGLKGTKIYPKGTTPAGALDRCGRLNKGWSYRKGGGLVKSDQAKKRKKK